MYVKKKKKARLSRKTFGKRSNERTPAAGDGACEERALSAGAQWPGPRDRVGPESTEWNVIWKVHVEIQCFDDKGLANVTSNH